MVRGVVDVVVRLETEPKSRVNTSKNTCCQSAGNQPLCCTNQRYPLRVQERVNLFHPGQNHVYLPRGSKNTNKPSIFLQLLVHFLGSKINTACSDIRVHLYEGLKYGVLKRKPRKKWTTSVFRYTNFLSGHWNHFQRLNVFQTDLPDPCWSHPLPAHIRRSITRFSWPYTGKSYRTFVIADFWKWIKALCVERRASFMGKSLTGREIFFYSLIYLMPWMELHTMKSELTP